MSDISDSLRAAALHYPINQTVGVGNCWAFVNEALVAAGGRSRYGRAGAALYQWGEVVRQRTSVRPGHVIQFSAISFFRFAPPPGTPPTVPAPPRSTGPCHSAIVIDVYNQGKQMLIRHQNFGVATVRQMYWYFEPGIYTEDGSRTVTIAEVDNTVTFYRPNTTS